MNKDEKRYVIDNEFEGAFVGTMGEILEWAGEHGVDIMNSIFYECGREVGITLKAID